MSEMPDNSGATFEEKLEAVQRMISRIESGTLPLEDSVRCYEEGMGLLKALDQELQDYSRRLTVLQTGPDGTEQETALEDTE